VLKEFTKIITKLDAFFVKS